MNNIKLVYSNYDEETGISTVRIQTPEGTFKGKSRLHPKDKNVASRYVGCKYAEMRAWIKYYKFMARLKQSAIEEVTKLSNQLNQDKNIPKRAKEWAAANLKLLEEERKLYKIAIDELKQDLVFEMEERDKFLKKINEHNQKAKK